MQSRIKARRGPAVGMLSVMMPIYNEERTLATILSHVLARPEVGELIAVDDGSVDGSWAILQDVSRHDARVRAFRLDRNRGKGAALRWAIEEISKPFALVQDADLEYDPRDYPALLEPLVSGRVDAVFGARGFEGQSAYSRWFVLGSRLVTGATNLLFGCHLRDTESGCKVLRSDLWRRLNLVENGFDVEPAIAARLTRLGYRIQEVPVSYYARGRKDGKKLNWTDGVRALGTLLRLRLRRMQSLFGREYDLGYHRRRQAELASRHPLMVVEPRAARPA